MTADIVPHNPDQSLAQDMDYARAVSSAALLPAAYRGKPADILIATGLGRAIGIPPAQALYEIFVVNGRPSPSANLMAALVRRAGHKLRIHGSATSCTATLIRADDPEAPFEATWTLEQAQAAKLTGKDTWKQYPQAMLRARAISEVVRMGAPEAILGMEYSREELTDVPAPTHTPPAQVSVADFTPAGDDDNTDDGEDPEPEPPTQAMTRKMFAALREVGCADRASGLAYVSDVVGRQVDSSKDLTRDEVSRILDELDTEIQRQAAAADDDAHQGELGELLDGSDVAAEEYVPGAGQ